MYEGINTPSQQSVQTGAEAGRGHLGAASEGDEFPIKLRIHSLRILTATVILIAALSYVTYLLMDGYKLTTTNATELSDADKEDLLDKYNSYSGGIASAIATPFEKLVAVLVPVLFLCFSTRAFLSPDHGVIAHAGPMVLAYALSWALDQSFNALNVQWDAPTVVYSIINSDLVAADSSSGFDIVMSNVDNSAKMAGIPSTDTILRSAIQPSTSISETNCTYTDGVLYMDRNPSIRYGFPSTYWYDYMMPKSVEADKTFSFGVSTDFEAQEIDASVLPSGDVSSTAVLLSYGLWAAWRQIGRGEIGNIESILNAIYSPNVGEMLALTKNLVMTNFSLAENTNESEATSLIKFEGVTFTFPLQAEVMQSWFEFGAVSGASDILELNTNTNCNERACALLTPNVDRTLQDQVRIIPLCMAEANGKEETVFNVSESYSREFPSSSSVLVSSLSRYITADEAIVNNEQQYIGLKNPRITRQITIGRLSWETENLANSYGATCAAEGNCNGLSFDLSNKKQHVVIGEEHIPKPFKVTYPAMQTTWQILAMAETQMSTSKISNLIYPPNYLLAAGSDEWTPLSGTNCNADGADFINDIIQQHMYSQDTIQPAYVAGLFWLFQNAAVKDIEVSNSKMAPAGVQLDFEGNQLWLSSRISIPRTSAFITFGGCAVVLLIGILVTFGAIGSRVETITSPITAHNVAGLRVGSSQYPSQIVCATVISDDKNGAVPAKDIEDFDIAEITLQDRQSGSIRSIKISRTKPMNVHNGLP